MVCPTIFFANFAEIKDKKRILWYDKIEIFVRRCNKLIKELCTRLLDNKIAQNENFIRFTFYELRVKNNLSENETEEFLKLCMTYLENKGYEVYIGNARYSYNNANQNVQPNELLIAFKDNKWGCNNVWNKVWKTKYW